MLCETNGARAMAGEWWVCVGAARRAEATLGTALLREHGATMGRAAVLRREHGGVFLRVCVSPAAGMLPLLHALFTLGSRARWALRMEVFPGRASRGRSGASRAE